MADNASLGAAKNAKNDEFYTQYSDIEAEMNAYVEFDPDVFRGKTILLPCDDPEWSNFTKYFASNFERFGLKKLISTSYAKGAGNKQLSMFEMMSPLYDENLHETRGKLFTLTRDVDGSGLIDTDDVEFSGYLEGDGDFRSAEVCALRDEADIIITNPPFSLFREFLAWIIEAQKQFVIIGSKNAITYKEVFPLLKENRIWLGPGFPGGNAFFRISQEDARQFASGVYDESSGLVKFRNVGWFTNIDHGQRHEPLLLDTMAHNLKYNKKLKKKFEEEYGVNEYPHYDNYDAIEVPFTECIPSDYVPCWFGCPKAAHCEWAAKKGMDGNAPAFCENVCAGNMGVPITFLDKHSPEQFEIVGADYELAEPELLENGKKGTDRFYIKKGVDMADDISDNCSQLAARSSQLAARSSQLAARSSQLAARSSAAALCADRRTPQDVTASWASPSRSSTSTIPSSLRSSGQQTGAETDGLTGAESRMSGSTHRLSTAEDSIRGSLYRQKCNGLMGVPITFLDKYNPEEFEIVDITKAGAGDPATKTKEYPRQIQVDKDGKRSSVTKLNDGADIVLSDPPVGKTYYIVDGVFYVQIYPRILIHRRKGGNTK